MNATPSPAWEYVQLVAKLADMKEDHYRSLLTLSAMLELMIEKGILSREELEAKTKALDTQLESLISASLHPMA